MKTLADIARQYGPPNEGRPVRVCGPEGELYCGTGFGPLLTSGRDLLQRGVISYGAGAYSGFHVFLRAKEAGA